MKLASDVILIILISTAIAAKNELDLLKEKVTAMGGNHSVKALDKYMKTIPSSSAADTPSKQNIEVI